MIKRDRQSVSIPDSLNSEKCLLEKERAISEYETSLAENRNFKFTFRAYSEEDIKDALIELFENKCAYCESEFDDLRHSFRVEHWRPKGEVVDKDGNKYKPGYYWLASDWENLFPSCSYCNEQKYRIIDGEKILLGKKDQFPLQNEHDRVRDHHNADKIDDEIPLLLNPCIDDAAEHIEFHEDGSVTTKNESEKGHQSLIIYALICPQIIRSREKHIKKIKHTISTIEKLTVLYDGSDSENTQQGLSELVEENMNQLENYTKSNSKFSLMARQIIEKQRAATLNKISDHS